MLSVPPPWAAELLPGVVMDSFCDTLSQRRAFTIVRASQPQGDRNRAVLGECGRFISPNLQLSRRWLQLQDRSSEIKGALWGLGGVSEARVGSRQLDLQELRRVSKMSNFLHLRVLWCQPFSSPFPPDTRMPPHMLCTST